MLAEEQVRLISTLVRCTRGADRDLEGRQRTRPGLAPRCFEGVEGSRKRVGTVVRFTGDVGMKRGGFSVHSSSVRVVYAPGPCDFARAQK